MNFFKRISVMGLWTAVPVAVFCLSSWQIETVQAQVKAKPAVPASRKQQEKKTPQPEHIILDTSDGVRLKCTYFGAPMAEGGDGKAVMPLILLHEWEGDRTQLLRFGLYMQSQGHAVIVPDLRGHGESTQVVGSDRPIKADKLRRQDVMNTQKDIERCKKFLVQKNNAGELNIDMLCVVAVGKTSVLAIQWVLRDWYEFPPVSPGGVKQGQDVKGLVLISPRKKLAGMSLASNLKHHLYTGAGGPALPMLILWGADDEEAERDSKSIHSQLEKARPDLSEIEDGAKRFEMQTLFGQAVQNTSSSGVQMMATSNRLWPFIGRFFAKKIIVKASEMPWASRETKNEE